jgi:hypothetical protein
LEIQLNSVGGSISVFLRIPCSIMLSQLYHTITVNYISL